MCIPRKDLLLYLRARLTKMNFKKTKRGKKTRDQRKSYKIQLQKKRQSGPRNANASVIRGDYEIESSSLDWGVHLVESDEENADGETEYLYCAGLYTGDRHSEKWLKCTKCYKWCHDECSVVSLLFLQH